MLRLTVEKIAEMCGGVIERSGKTGKIKRVAIDSRRIKRGDLFVAIKGEHQDGHKFMSEAARRGCTALLLARGARQRPPVGPAVIRVADTTLGLGKLAAAWRRELKSCVIGITGSSGKTTTKELLRCALGGGAGVVASEQSYNNQYGVPLTLLSVSSKTKTAVLEMGMNQRGEIAYLAEMSRPDIGVITNVGSSHIGRLGSKRAIAVEKSRLLKVLPKKGRAVLNADCPDSRRIAASAPCLVVTFARHRPARVRARHVRRLARGGTAFDIVYRGESYAVRLKHPGEHNVSNALAAFAAAVAAGVAPARAAAGLSRAKISLAGRMHVRPWRGGSIVDDSYNANPDSMRAALAFMHDQEAARKVAVLGDMLELGKLSRALHRKLGEELAGRDIDLLVTVGSASEWIGRGSGFGPERWRHFKRPLAAAAWVKKKMCGGETVLVKGSRGMGMEVIVKKITEVGAVREPPKKTGNKEMEE